MSKTVFQYDKNGRLIKSFCSVREAERLTGVDNSNIAKCCNLDRGVAGGFYWSYQEKFSENLVKK